MKMDKNLDEKLKRLCNTTSGPYLRPFRATTRWRDAKVLIVGANPATSIPREVFNSFDDYWMSLTEDPTRFKQVIDAVSKDGKSSRTTQRIEELCKQINGTKYPGIKYLIANACAYPCAREAQVPRMQWDVGEKIFAELLKGCNPAVVFGHGRRAKLLLEKTFNLSLDPFQPPAEQNAVAGAILLLCAPHLSGLGLTQPYNVVCAIPEFAKRIQMHLSPAKVADNPILS